MSPCRSTPSLRAALAAGALLSCALCAAAQPPIGSNYVEITAPDGRVLKKMLLDRREEEIDGKTYLLRASYIESPDRKHKVVYERKEDPALEDRALRRSSQTTLATWYAPDGSVVSSKRFGGRFRTLALSASGNTLAAADMGYTDVVTDPRLPPDEARTARALSESRMYVFDSSWRTVFSTAALRGDWDPVRLSPSGSWLLYENVTESEISGGKGWYLTAVELAGKRVYRTVWERDLHAIGIGDDGTVSAQRFLGLTEEEVPTKLADGSTGMRKNAIYIKLLWDPATGGGFKPVKEDQADAPAP